MPSQVDAFDSSLTGLSAVSAAEFVGDEVGGLLLDGKTDGVPAGVAELEGMFGNANGVAAAPVGPSDTTGAVSGAITGLAVGMERVTGGKTDGGNAAGGRVAVGVGEATCGVSAREVFGDSTGAKLFVGGRNDGSPPGEFGGKVVGGKVVVGVGEEKGVTGLIAGVVWGDSTGVLLLAGEAAGLRKAVDGESEEGGLASVAGVAAGAGALSAYTTPETKTITRTNRAKDILVLWDRVGTQ
ncbi:hypothetical protein K2173_015501 [Erythroxylum novogranatense]|uniref:Uncharacterized protein n=1 Tax=Erythroxylum novogranatense TaxID=1862640 RepID=A0AAV8SSQ7_9ROSI|nr:hypothetical protein K2173_015501 [Erythroxylum novogranatense]